MSTIERRSFLGAALAAAASPFALIRESVAAATPVKTALVPNGADRAGALHTIGVSTTAYKVSGQDSQGGLFIMEHSNHKKGGPPRHLHHNEDEWFYAIEGEYILEVAGKQVRLKPGDSILAPREVPHAWAFVGESPGKMLIAFAPANKMEEFFAHWAPGAAYNDDAALYHAYGLELLGPPISVE